MSTPARCASSPLKPCLSSYERLADTYAMIRLAREADAEAIRRIYAPIVSETATSFEETPPDVEEMSRRIARTLEFYPWLVCEQDRSLQGYAYASRHRARAAYDWCVEVSAYVDAPARGRGVGRALYASLLEVLRLQGFRVACAAIALPNAASVALHEAAGFTAVGTFTAIGYKLGAWHDVGWWELSLLSPSPQPVRPVRLPDLGRRALEHALRSGESNVKSDEPA